MTSPAPTNVPTRRRASPKAPVLFALGLIVLAVVVTATWAITWSVAGDDASAQPPSSGSVDDKQAPGVDAAVETVRATTESLYNFTPDTVEATIKTAQATLCGEALEQWNETAGTLPDIVYDTGRSVTTSNAHYGVVRSDQSSTTVLAIFDLAASEDNTDPPPPEPTAIEFTVDRNAVPVCITTMKVL
ncbi:hypothetical protein BH683_009350 [Williamsia sp. 1138]|uniref:hypothetical protein n=1 Tax=Williamsia sp. 1138 TaxID=1903117 RepID=UPI000A10E1D0|nr:hypothetical protein [Williamsia sp. 1138]OZG29378.1 hypothetical protein BH683_009350 [Williamsia sp. 1138]